MDQFYPLSTHRYCWYIIIYKLGLICVKLNSSYPHYQFSDWIPIMWYIVLSNTNRLCSENDAALSLYSTPFTSYYQYKEMKINFHSRVLGR